MSTKELKGKSVRCVSHTYGAENDGVVFTPGKHYPILAVEGDRDTVLGGRVFADGLIVDTDTCGQAYIKLDGAHGVFEVVE